MDDLQMDVDFDHGGYYSLGKEFGEIVKGPEVI